MVDNLSLLCRSRSEMRRPTETRESKCMAGFTDYVVRVNNLSEITVFHMCHYNSVICD